MDKFKYKRLVVDHREVDKALNQQGRAGWELVGFQVDQNGGTCYTLIFKRKLLRQS